MSGSAEEMAGEPGQAEPPVDPPTAESLLAARADRASELKGTAATLKEEAWRLRTSLPEADEDPVGFFLRGLDAVKDQLNRVTPLFKDCERLVEQMGEAKQVADAAGAAVGDEGKAVGEDADQMELDALRDLLTHFSAAVYRAFEAWLTAAAAMNRRSSHSSRSKHYGQAAAELAEIAEHCQALAKQLEGEAGLPG
jgi:hypothetical protein